MLIFIWPLVTRTAACRAIYDLPLISLSWSPCGSGLFGQL
ncbi:hypothetical protein A4U88_3287 [Serratia marcescens]|nr:hypothetical protein A4U88_3287 [Serratia marcescens]